MAPKTNTEVFLPLTYKTYKENKINLLKTNLIAVKTANRIKKINELRKIKTEQKRLLKKIIKDIRKSYNKIQKLLPKEKETKITEKYTHKTNTHLINQEIIKNQTSIIDQELLKINERIKNLNNT